MNIEKGMIIGFSKMGESLAIENIAEVKEYNSNANTIITNKCASIIKQGISMPQAVSEFGIIGAINMSVLEKKKIVGEIEINLNNFDFVYQVNNTDILNDFNNLFSNNTFEGNKVVQPSKNIIMWGFEL